MIKRSSASSRSKPPDRIIATSHSPYLIDQLAAEEVRLMINVLAMTEVVSLVCPDDPQRRSTGGIGLIVEAKLGASRSRFRWFGHNIRTPGNKVP